MKPTPPLEVPYDIANYESTCKYIRNTNALLSADLAGVRIVPLTHC